MLPQQEDLHYKSIVDNTQKVGRSISLVIYIFNTDLEFFSYNLGTASFYHDVNKDASNNQYKGRLFLIISTESQQATSGD